MAGLFNECTYFITDIVLKAALIDVNTKRAILWRCYLPRFIPILKTGYLIKRIGICKFTLGRKLV